MSDQVSRFEDLERTDVLPQLGFQPEEADDNDTQTHARLTPPAARAPQTPAPRNAVAPFGSGSHADNGQLRTLPAKPSPTDLAVGGIRGKIADLENRLLEAQDHQIDLNRHCEQLTQKCRSADERAIKAEANYVTQSSELYRAGQRAADAEQRLTEQRVRYEAQIVDAERQLLDARTRAEKRTSSLELMLKDQSERAASSEQLSAELRVELEKLRAELGASYASVQSLESRLAEQTRAASEVSKLYAQQTSEVSTANAAMAEDQRRMGDLERAKTEAETQLATVRAELKSTSETVLNLQTEVTMKLRHIAALEHGLEHRDRSIAELQSGKSQHESDAEQLKADKEALDLCCAELRKEAAEARELVTKEQAEIARLKTALQGNDVRLNDLAAALRSAESAIKDRDGSLAELERRQSDLLNGKQSKDAEFESLHKTMEKVMAERDRLELENQTGRAELSRAESQYEEAVKTIMTARETISMREQQNASLERELRAATGRLEEAHSRIERAAATAESFEVELRERDGRIALLEQKLTEHAGALAAIGQDIERVNASSPNERLSSMGYALESLDTPGVIHRITRMTTTAGRSDTNDIAINSTSVSRFHARIVVKPEGVWLIDLQSTNGCGVNGRRTSRQILCDGDAVMIGHCRFRFSVLGVESAKNVSKDAIPLIDESMLIPGPNAGAQAKHH